MSIIQLIKIFLRHFWLLISVPLLLAIIVIYLTKNQTYYFESKTTIYTGIASGYNLDQDKRVDFFVANNSFDNLMNIIKSRETLTEVAIRLLTQGLILDSFNPIYISKESFIELRKNVPQNVKNLVVKPLIENDSLAYRIAFEQTVQNLYNFKNSTDTNYIYSLLNYPHKHYSLRALAGVEVKRIGNSDLVELTYKNDDPGISLQTLVILTEVFIRNFKAMKENQSDAVVKYFTEQVRLSQIRLKEAEDRLLEFNKSNNIINYYEQSKYIAEKKEDIDEFIQKEKMKYMGAEQALKKLEDKLQIQGQIHGISDQIIMKRNRLIEITEKITINDIYNEPDTVSKAMLSKLRVEATQLQKELNQDLNELYQYSNTIEGIPLQDLLKEWLKNLVILAESKAGIKVLIEHQQDFQKNYQLFAPLGANLSRIEREIDVCEREYLSLLHSLSQAKLRQQNEELSANIKVLDNPFYPLNAKPSKRKIFVLAAAFFGFLIVAFVILLTEYFDNTIKTLERAQKLTGLSPAGLMPKIIGKYQSFNLPFISNRLCELIIQEIKLHTNTNPDEDERTTKIISVFSTVSQEGKSFIAGKLVQKLRSVGDQVLYLNFLFKPETDVVNERSHSRHEESASIENKGIMGLFSKLKANLPIFNTEEDLQSITNKDNLTYLIDDSFTEKQDIFDLLPDNQITSLDKFRYVIIELPAILYYPYPPDVVAQSHLSLMVVRANREWKKADSSALVIYNEVIKTKSLFVLNGTDIEEVETVLGLLPKKRSRLRRFVRQALNFQFYSKSSIN